MRQRSINININFIFHIFKFLSVVFLIKSVSSIEDVVLNNLSLSTVSSLLKILEKFKTDLAYVKIEPNVRKHKEDYRNKYKNLTQILNEVSVRKFQRPGKHILIKRLLPHGLAPAKLEYDRKYKTLYRPLVRVHKRISLPKVGTILNINGNAKGINEYGIDIYDYFDNDEDVLKFVTKKDLNDNLKHFKVDNIDENFNVDEELLQPFSTKFPGKEDSFEHVSMQLRLLEEIHTLLWKIRSRSTTNPYRDIVKVLDKISSLRSHQKSGEDNDPLAPGKPINQDYDEIHYDAPAPKKWIPHYPPWNYWTYKKTIYQDACPKGQVKSANLCIRIPPH